MVGDQVRISKKKKCSRRGFTPNLTEELFTILNVRNTKPPTYTIQDLRGEPVKGIFYEEELQKSSGGFSESFREIPGFQKISNVSKNDCLFVFSVGGGNIKKNVSLNIINA